MAYGMGNNYGMNMQYQNNMNPYYQNSMYQGGQMQSNNMMNQQSNMQYGGMGTVNQNAPRMYVRPVSGYDEANASMIDLDGSMYVFTDIANGKIYTKQILLDGTADVKTYVLANAPKQEEAIPVEVKSTNDYVLKKDYNKAIKSINEKLNKIMEVVENESNDSIASNTKK